jgi:hypothetical protein
MGEMTDAYTILVESPGGKDTIWVDILLRWFLKKQDLRVWTGFMWLKTGTSVGVF